MNPDRLKQIEDLYHRALDYQPGERARFLDDACGSDDALREEVESLLVHADRPQFLESSAIEAADPRQTQAPNAPTLRSDDSPLSPVSGMR